MKKPAEKITAVDDYIGNFSGEVRKKLLEINKKLWDIENQIREKESSGTFDNKFISLARAVYITNDKRSEIKNKINTLFGAAIKEIKEYSGY